MSVFGNIRGARSHPGYAAALVHRLSGVALSIFLPLHFLSLGLAFDKAAFSQFVTWTDQPLVKITEALVVAALAVHMAGGLRVLAVEFLGLSRGHALWIALALAFGAGVALLFLMNAF